MTTTIRPQHLQRPAYVYLRQSTPGQVHTHRESTERQYALAGRAVALGWIGVKSRFWTKIWAKAVRRPTGGRISTA
jgi:hypothetical protein